MNENNKLNDIALITKIISFLECEEYSLRDSIAVLTSITAILYLKLDRNCEKLEPFIEIFRKMILERRK